MVSNRIGLEYKYDFSSPKFRTAFEFLSRKDLGSLPLGWIDLDNGVRASVQGYETIAPAEGFYETHEKYFDIQYVVSGKEYVGVTTRDGLKVKTPYDKDGDYIILAPEDVHKPRLTAGEKVTVKKIVVKVPV